MEHQCRCLCQAEVNTHLLQPVTACESSLLVFAFRPVQLGLRPGRRFISRNRPAYRQNGSAEADEGRAYKPAYPYRECWAGQYAIDPSRSGGINAQ